MPGGIENGALEVAWKEALYLTQRVFYRKDRTGEALD